YHASNIPPGALPGSKTQMAFRSKTHKGEGYNELLFEDAKGSELLSLHAQRNMKTVVKNDQSLLVEAGNRTLTVQTGDEHKTVKQGNLTETICLKRSTEANTVQVKAKAGKAGPGTQLYQAEDNITLQVGKGSIEMTPEHIRVAFGSSVILLNSSGVFVDGSAIGLNNGSAGAGLAPAAADGGDSASESGSLLPVAVMAAGLGPMGMAALGSMGLISSASAATPATRPMSPPVPDNVTGRPTVPTDIRPGIVPLPSAAPVPVANSADSTEKTMDQDGLDLLKGIESLRLKPYDDQTGKTITKWNKGATIGYGKLIAEKEWNTYKDGITEEKAEELFKETLAPFEKTVNSAITKEIKQNQFDALVMFAYNIGKKGFKDSSVVKLVNDENAKTDYDTLDDAWKAWNKSQGEVNQGVINRRKAELKIYNEGVYERW
ncbi:glycoside hydrolase family protein, partial [Xenorhabdus sp. XENO-7]